jgi:hypothetical protein
MLTLQRDPWWILTTVSLFYNIKVRYDLRIIDIIRISPRFGIMMGAMILSIAFIILDVCSVTDAFKSVLPIGINPFWKLSFVFKCLTDSVVLDDFKTALDRLRAFRISRMGSLSIDNPDRRARGDGELENAWEEARAPDGVAMMPSPDGDYIRPHWPGMKDGANHVESIVPNQARDSTSKNMSMEDIVFSATPGSPRSRMQLQDVEHLAQESDYARAVREMSNESPTRNHLRPSRSP